MALLDFGFGWPLLLGWWAFLLIMWKVTRICVGYQRINTYTFFFPLLLLTNGFLVPFTKVINAVAYGYELRHFETYWLALAVMYLSLPIGILAANLYRRPGTLAASSEAPLEESRSLGFPMGSRIYLAATFAISAISLLQIYGKGIQFDLISYLSGSMDYQTYLGHRNPFAQATSGLDFWLYNKLPYSIAPLGLILIWTADAFKRWQKWLFTLTLLLAVVQTGHKMPVVNVLLTVLVAKLLLRRKMHLTRSVKVALAVAFLAIIFVVIPGFYILQGEATYGSALTWSLTRTLLETERGLQLYFEVYPHFHPFLHGGTLKSIALLQGVEYVQPSAYVPAVFLGVEGTSFPVLFIGEAWADFGYAGVIAMSILVGFVLQIYNVWFYNRRSAHAEEMALFLSIILGGYHLLETAFPTALFTYGLVASWLVYLFIRAFPAMPEAASAAPVSQPSLGST